MNRTDSDGEQNIRKLVREEVSQMGRSVLSTIVWTVLSIVAVLTGLQSIQLVGYTNGIVAAGFVSIGVIITTASLYLLYLLYR